MSNPPLQLRWTHKLILVGFSLLFALVLVEIAGHALGLLPVLSDAQYRAVIRRVGTLRPPYDHFTNTGFVAGNAEFKVDIRLNKLGFRGDDIAASPPQGSQRLLVMGDSYTAGWEVKQQEMWSAWLSRTLNAGDASYDVANTGFPGLGTDREYLLYQAYGRTLEPDVVILVMYVENDVSDNGIALWTSPDEVVQTRPYFTLDDQGKLVEHPWRYVDRTRSYEREPFPRRVTGWLNAHSITYRVLRDAAREGWSAVTGNEGQKSSPAATGNDQPPDPDHPGHIPQPLEVMFTEPDEKWEQAWQISGELLRSFRAAVEADGARLVVVIVPPHMIVQNDYWPYADLFDASGRAWEVEYPQTRMLALLDEVGIPALNPTQDFIDFRRATGQDLFFVRDRHFNPTGTCVFGTLLANWLAGQGIVAPDAAPRDPVAVCS